MKSKNLKTELFKTMSQLATAAFGFVAALAWNDAIKSLIDKFVSEGSGLRSKFYYAIIATVLAVVISYYLGRLTQAQTNKEKSSSD